MAKFRFKLEPVLKQRDAILKDRQRQLAGLNMDRVAFDRQLNQLHGQVSEDRHRMAEGLVGSVDVARIRDHAAHAAQVVMRAGLITARQRQLDEKIHEARGHLVEASRAHKALERLRDVRWAAWKAEQDRLETKALDELATQRHVRRWTRSEVGR